LGKYLLSTAPKDLNGKPLFDVMSTYHQHRLPGGIRMDVCNRQDVARVISRVEPDAIIHCAAEGRVDSAYEHYEHARTVNFGGLINVMDGRGDSRVVFVSSNAVFDGDNPPYREGDKRSPVNSYGNIKVECEDLIINESNWIIVRPIMLYGRPYNWGRENWATRVINSLRNEREISVVDDVETQPTYAKDVAKGIWRLLGVGVMNQSYHIASQQTTTLYEFAKTVAEVYDLNQTLIKPISSSNSLLNGFDKRPKDTTFDVSLSMRMGIHCGNIKEGLIKMKREMEL